MRRVRGLVGYFYRHKFIRYLFVGGTTFIIDEGLLILLHGGAHVWLPLALFVAYSIAFVYNFSLNRWWAFSASENNTVRQHIVPYTALFLFNLIFAIVFVSLVSQFIHYAIAKAVSVIIQTSWTFLIYKNVIFVSHPPHQPADEQSPSPY